MTCHLDVRGFYLFLAQETTADAQYVITALALYDGNMLEPNCIAHLVEQLLGLLCHCESPEI